MQRIMATPGLMPNCFFDSVSVTYLWYHVWPYWVALNLYSNEWSWAIGHWVTPGKLARFIRSWATLNYHLRRPFDWYWADECRANGWSSHWSSAYLWLWWLKIVSWNVAREGWHLTEQVAPTSFNERPWVLIVHHLALGFTIAVWWYCLVRNINLELWLISMDNKRRDFYTIFSAFQTFRTMPWGQS